MTAQANLDQERYWNTDGGPRWVELGAHLDRQLEGIGETAMAAGRPAPGEAVLDVGCGAGATSVALAAAVAPGGRVLGVDISEPLLARARARDVSAVEADVSFRRADAQEADWGDDRFDLVYSRFGVMFFADPPAAFANLRAATRPGGRLAFVCWQKAADNEWSAVPARAVQPLLPPAPPPDPLAPGPFAFARADRARSILTDAGWAEIDVAPLQTTIQLGGTADFEEAVHVSINVGPVGRAMQGLPEDQRPAVIEAIRAALRPFHVEGEGCRMAAAFWLVSAFNPS